MASTTLFWVGILIAAPHGLFVNGAACNLPCSQSICESRRICPEEAPYSCIKGNAAGTCATWVDEFVDSTECTSCCNLNRCDEDLVGPEVKSNHSSYARDVDIQDGLVDGTVGALCAIGAFALLACCCMTYVGRRTYAETSKSLLAEEEMPLHQKKKSSWCCGGMRSEDPGTLILQFSNGVSGVKWEGYNLTLHDEYTLDRRDPSAVYACVKRGAGSAKWLFEKSGKGYLISLVAGGRDVDRPSYLTLEDGSDENFQRDVRDPKSLYVIGTTELARAGKWERVSVKKGTTTCFYIKLIGTPNRAAKSRVGYYLSALDGKSMDRRDNTSAFAMVHKDEIRASLWTISH